MVTAPPKRTVKAMSRKQLEKELEGTGVTPAKDSSKEELTAQAVETSSRESMIDEPFKGEY